MFYWHLMINRNLRFFELIHSVCCFRLHFFDFNVFFPKKKKSCCSLLLKKITCCAKIEKKISRRQEKSQPPPWISNGPSLIINVLLGLGFIGTNVNIQGSHNVRYISMVCGHFLYKQHVNLGTS